MWVSKALIYSLDSRIWQVGQDRTRKAQPGISQLLLKLTGFPKGEPDSLCCRDSPWISSYHIQIPFHLNITDITHVYKITWVYYIIRRIILRIPEYKPLGLKENKQKAETISSLLGKLLLHEFSPQAARWVARAFLHIFFLHHPVDSSTWILHLLGYPQGRDRFMSPSVCKLYGGCKRCKDNAKDRLCFPNVSKIYKSSKTPFNTGSPGIPDSRSPIFHYNCLNPVSVRELPLPAPQLLSEQEKWTRGR